MARAVLSESSIETNQVDEGIMAAQIDATDLETKELNDRLRDLMLSGVKKVNILNVCGQRYIGTRLYTPQHLKMEIEIFGTPGNDLAAFLYGHKITVHGNAQDGVGNTMDAGEIIVEGRAGDVLGFSMRGGEIYVRDNCGYRTALHMKEYEEKRPVLVIGGSIAGLLGRVHGGRNCYNPGPARPDSQSQLHRHRHAWWRDLSARPCGAVSGRRAGGHFSHR